MDPKETKELFQMAIAQNILKMIVEKTKIKVFPRHAPGYAGHVKT